MRIFLHARLVAAHSQSSRNSRPATTATGHDSSIWTRAVALVTLTRTRRMLLGAAPRSR